jgi:membrane protease subunit (stomatin/prohibitin family)
MQQAAPAGNWFCQSCGAANTGGFCQSCGTKKA